MACGQNWAKFGLSVRQPRVAASAGAERRRQVTGEARPRLKRAAARRRQAAAGPARKLVHATSPTFSTGGLTRLNAAETVGFGQRSPLHEEGRFRRAWSGDARRRVLWP